MIARRAERWRTGMEAAGEIDWHREVFEALRAREFSLAAHVPDAGHAPLIRMCEDCPEVDCLTLTTEEEGVGVVCGAWAGGCKGVLLMQSSGVGNCINALALPAICRIPFLTVVTMRGEWGEFIPWQLPMGQATPDVLRAMGLLVLRVERREEAAATVDAGAALAHNGRRSVAVLLSQKMIGAKHFEEGQ